MKKRFDSIFESTNYTKALDAIRKEKKEKVGISLQIHQQKETLVQLEKDEVDKQNKYNQALRIRNEIECLGIASAEYWDEETQIESTQAELSTLSTQLSTLESHMQFVQSEVRRYEEVNQLITNTSRDLDLQKQVTLLRSTQ